MNNATALRALTLTGLTAGFVLVIAAIAWACVPQRGTLEVQVSATGTDVNTAESGRVVGDGNPNTNHWQSWCGDYGGHPVDAAYAAVGDDITVTVGPATKGQINPDAPCPESDSELPEGPNEIWVANGAAYVWDEPYNYNGGSATGFWNFDPNQVNKDTPGCFKGGEPYQDVKQGEITVNHGQDDSKTFTLDDGGQNWSPNTGGTSTNQPGDDASVLCIGAEAPDLNEQVGIFAPLFVTSV